MSSYVDTVFAIESRKYDQSLHRRWDENTVLYQNEFFIVGFNDRTNVTEQNKPIWQTTEPAIFYFDRRYWFNIIFILTEEPFYYCNLSSPFLYLQGVLQYIDYDLDVLVYPDGTYQLLDQDEYKENCRLYDYPLDVQNNISKHLNLLLQWIEAEAGPFNKEGMNTYLSLYRKINEK